MSRASPSEIAVDEIYLDESSHTAHRYLLLGGLSLGASQSGELEAVLKQVRLPELPAMEMGWTKVSRSKLEAYRRFVDVFFDNRNGFSPFHFHTLIIDTHKLNHHKHNDGSGEIGFNKEVYQLCSKFARIYRDKLFHVFPDKRSSKSSPDELRLILNRGIKKRGDGRDWPFRRIHPRESCDWQALQLVDLLLGAVAFHANGHAAKPDASAAKTELSDHILRRAGIKDVMRDTAITGKFTIWHRQLK